MSESPAAWKIWYPLSFWHALLIVFVAQLAMFALILALRVGLGLAINMSWGSAVGGGLGFLIIVWLANKRRAEAASEDSAKHEK